MRRYLFSTLCVLLFVSASSAQCIVPLGNTAFNTVINGTTIGQTYLGQCDGSITSITVQSNSFDSLIPNVTLRIYEGNDVTGRIVRYIKPNITLNGRARPTTILLDGNPAPVSILGQYTLQLTHDFTNLELHAQSGGAAYLDGDVVDNMFDPVIPLADLVFQIVADIDLPVELLGFRAFAQNEKIVLEWQTAKEVDNEGFYVEHSQDGENWQDIGFVRGAGDSEVPQSYRFVDENLAKVKHYYRLRQLDFSGVSESSEIVTVSLGKAAGFSLYPNPAKGELVLLTNEAFSGQNISIYRMDGQLIRQLTYAAETFAAGRIHIAIDDLAPGVYMVKVGHSGSQRFVKE